MKIIIKTINSNSLLFTYKYFESIRSRCWNLSISVSGTFSDSWSWSDWFKNHAF